MFALIMHFFTPFILCVFQVHSAFFMSRMEEIDYKPIQLGFLIWN